MTYQGNALMSVSSTCHTADDPSSCEVMATERLVIEAVAHGVRVVGDLDLHTAGRLPPALDLHPGDIEIDVSQVSFIDATGLRVLIAAHQRRASRGQRLWLVNPSDAVRRTLEATGLCDYLPTRSTGPRQLSTGQRFDSRTR